MAGGLFRPNEREPGMSETAKPADDSANKGGGATVPESPKSPKPVDTAAQEDAAKDREESGGYN